MPRINATEYDNRRGELDATLVGSGINLDSDTVRTAHNFARMGLFADAVYDAETDSGPDPIR